MNRIPVNCHTNLDEYKREIWPSYFCSPPKKGDVVCARSGKLLGICAVMHCVHSDGYPYLDIELTAPVYGQG